MEFDGIQKLSCLDYPGLVACTVFTKGCNFRCPFCHNASLVLSPKEGPELGTDQFFSFLEKRSINSTSFSNGAILSNSSLVFSE